jgi:hypothetical protein
MTRILRIAFVVCLCGSPTAVFATFHAYVRNEMVRLTPLLLTITAER